MILVIELQLIRSIGLNRTSLLNVIPLLYVVSCRHRARGVKNVDSIRHNSSLLCFQRWWWHLPWFDTLNSEITLDWANETVRRWQSSIVHYRRLLWLIGHLINCLSEFSRIGYLYIVFRAYVSFETFLFFDLRSFLNSLVFLECTHYVRAGVGSFWVRLSMFLGFLNYMLKRRRYYLLLLFWAFELILDIILGFLQLCSSVIGLRYE